MTSIYILCQPEIAVSDGDLEAVLKMYPYCSFNYVDLGHATRAFIRAEFAGEVPATELVATSQHNGYGRQWGIILLKRPGQDWMLVAQFGHRDEWERFWFLRKSLRRMILWTGFWNGRRGLRSHTRPRRLADFGEVWPT